MAPAQPRVFSVDASKGAMASSTAVVALVEVAAAEATSAAAAATAASVVVVCAEAKATAEAEAASTNLKKFIPGFLPCAREVELYSEAERSRGRGSKLQLESSQKSGVGSRQSAVGSRRKSQESENQWSSLASSRTFALWRLLSPLVPKDSLPPTDAGAMQGYVVTACDCGNVRHFNLPTSPALSTGTYCAEWLFLRRRYDLGREVMGVFSCKDSCFNFELRASRTRFYAFCTEDHILKVSER